MPVPVNVERAPFVNARDVSPVLLLRFNVVSVLSPVPVKDVRAFELRLRVVTAPSPVPVKDARVFELRLSDCSALRFPCVIPNDPIRLFHEKSSAVTSLPLQVTPSQLQAVVEIPHHTLSVQFRPPFVSKISINAQHCVCQTSVTVEQKEGQTTLRVLQVSSALILSHDDVAPPKVISERQLLVTVSVFGESPVIPGRVVI